MKSRFLQIIGAGIMSFLMAVTMVMPAWAKDCGNLKEDVNFMSFRPWYYGLEMDSTCSPTGELEDIIGQIVLNVIYDLMHGAAFVALFMILYAAYLMMLSGGDPGKYAKGKKTLVGAIVGLIITMIAQALIAFLFDTLSL